jgi:hypothetical protein
MCFAVKRYSTHASLCCVRRKRERVSPVLRAISDSKTCCHFDMQEIAADLAQPRQKNMAMRGHFGGLSSDAMEFGTTQCRLISHQRTGYFRSALCIALPQHDDPTFVAIAARFIDGHQQGAVHQRQRTIVTVGKLECVQRHQLGDEIDDALTQPVHAAPQGMHSIRILTGSMRMRSMTGPD